MLVAVHTGQRSGVRGAPHTAHMTAYDIDVTFEDEMWVAVVRGVPGGATETRDRGSLEPAVRDLLGGLFDVDGDELDLTFHD